MGSSPASTPTEAGAIPWERTSLGAREAWPPALTAAANIVESSSHPMYVAWGDDLIMIPNEAYLLLLGEALDNCSGKPLRQVQRDWRGSDELIDDVLSGKPIWAEDIPFRLRRGGAVETAYFTFSYTPL